MYAYATSNSSVPNQERGAFLYSETHYQTVAPSNTSQTDDFTGTNGSAPNSTNWSVAASTGGTATIQSNALQITTGTLGAYNDAIRLTNLAPQSLDVHTTLDVTCGDSTKEAYFEIMMRAQQNGFSLGGNGYKFELTNNGTVSIQKVASFSGTVLGSGVSVSGFATGVVVHLDAQVSGSTLTLYAWTGATKPGTPTIQVTDTTYASDGYLGIFLNGGNAAASTTWTVDNWTLTASSAGGVTGYTPLDPTTVSNAVANGQTQVYRYFYMERYLAQDTIEQAYLDLITADIATVRNAGAKLIIRFAYSNTDIETYPYGNPDPVLSRVLAHINALAPVLNAGADVIEAVQAGFIGIWGEWYYTANYTAGTDPSAAPTTQNWSDRKAVLAALLSQLDARIFILVRYVGIKPNYFGQTTRPTDTTLGGYWDRMGFHDDAIGAPGGDDYGTFSTFTWAGWANPVSDSQAFLASHTHVPFGGEIASSNVTYAAFKNEMATYHANFWNPSDFAGSQAGQGWTAGNLTEIGQVLGHRLRLVSATLPTTGAHGGATAVAITIANDGIGYPLRNWPVYLDFVPTGAGTLTSVQLNGDLRMCGPSGSTLVGGTVTLPATADTYAMHLRIADPSPSLASNAKYCLQMANTGGVWNAGTGRNSLLANVVVT